MTTVPEIQEVLAERKINIAKEGNYSKRFTAEILLEQADVLLKDTGQYAKWRYLRQNNDKAALLVAKNLLERHVLLEKRQDGQNIDRVRFDGLTAQLRKSGIHLYTASQLPQQPSGSRRISATYPVISSNAQPGFSGSSSSTSAVPSTFISTPAPSTSRVVAASTSFVSPPSAAVPKHVSAPSPSDISPKTSSRSLLDEENLLILTMHCPEVGLSKDVFAYGDQDSVLLPLTPLVQELDFAITVEPDAGKAEGWFISEDRKFLLDMDRQKITINGATSSLAPGSVFIDNNEIYVTADTISQWFPLDIDTSFSELTVNITPREKLPFQLGNDRVRRNSGWSATDIPLQYPVRPLEYDAFSLPVLDVNSNIGYGDLGRESARVLGAYSVLAQGDFAYMGANVYIAGHEGDPVDTARIRLERVDPEGGLLGPLHASRVAIGDVLPVSFPVLYDSQPERGVFVSNVDPVRSIDFDTTRFEGNLSPGWDVELYRNDALLWTSKVGLDGRYFIDDVPLYYGKNDFVLKAFGPQGQEKIIEEKALTVGLEMLAKGKSVFQLSASQRKKTILGIDEKNRYSEGEGGRFSARYQYGLNENLSFASRVSSVEFDGQRHNYLQAGISGITSWLYGSADFLYDTADGAGLSFFGQTALGPVDIRARQEFFTDFVMEDRPNNILKSRTELDLRGTVDETSILPEYSYRLSGRSTQFTNYTTSKVSGGVSTKIADIYLSNYLVWNYDNLRNDDTAPLEGNFQATGYIGSLRLSGKVRYDLGDTGRLTRYGVEGQWSVMQDLRAGGSVYHDADDYDRTTVSARLDWDAGFATVSPSLSYNSDDEYGAFVGLSFSLGQDPVTGGPRMSSRKIGKEGSVMGVVYHDKNTNAVFDEGDTPLAEVRIQAVQYRKSEKTDENGRALVTGLNAFEPTDIALDTDTLDDPFWSVAGDRVAIRPRPGHLDRVEFPIVTTGVIDGTLYFVDADGNEKELVNAVLEIVDSQGEVAMTTRSEYDGFYLFEQVMPGEYTLRISPNDKRNSAVAGELAIPVTIGSDGTILNGTDIVLRDPDAPEETEQLAIMEPYPLPVFENISTPSVSEQIESSRSAPESVGERSADFLLAKVQEQSDDRIPQELLAEADSSRKQEVRPQVPPDELGDPDEKIQGIVASGPTNTGQLSGEGNLKKRSAGFADWAFDSEESMMRPVVEYSEGREEIRTVSAIQTGPISFVSPIEIHQLEPVRRINPLPYDEVLEREPAPRNPRDGGGSTRQRRNNSATKGFRAIG